MSKIIPSHVLFRRTLWKWEDFVGQTITEGEFVMYLYDSDRLKELQKEVFEAGRRVIDIDSDIWLYKTFNDYLKSLENDTGN